MRTTAAGCGSHGCEPLAAPSNVQLLASVFQVIGHAHSLCIFVFILMECPAFAGNQLPPRGTPIPQALPVIQQPPTSGHTSSAAGRTPAHRRNPGSDGRR